MAKKVRTEAEEREREYNRKRAALKRARERMASGVELADLTDGQREALAADAAGGITMAAPPVASGEAPPGDPAAPVAGVPASDEPAAGSGDVPPAPEAPPRIDAAPPRAVPRSDAPPPPPPPKASEPRASKSKGGKAGADAAADGVRMSDGRWKAVETIGNGWIAGLELLEHDLADVGVKPILSIHTDGFRAAIYATVNEILPAEIELTPPMAAAAVTSVLMTQRLIHAKAIKAKKAKYAAETQAERAAHDAEDRARSVRENAAREAQAQRDAATAARPPIEVETPATPAPAEPEPEAPRVHVRDSDIGPTGPIPGQRRLPSEADLRVIF